MTMKGECLCGSVKYEITGSLGEVRYCHCLRCRQATGTAFSTNARIPEEQFKLLAGHDDLSNYEMGPGIHRHFCTRCGSPAFVNLDRDPGFIRPRIGAMIGDVDVNIAAHVWVGSKADWHDITDDLPQFDEAKPPDESQLLIISGSVGVGKTTAGEELSAILEDEEIGHTFVDLDGLSKTYPRSSVDRFGEQIALRNLRAVWANAQELGTRNLIVARVIETTAGAQRIADTVGAKHHLIIQLNASDDSLLNRVQQREIGSGRAWHERRAIELSRQLRGLKIADIEIDTDDKSIASIAREVREHLNWAKA